jgi:hypothetical protein
MTLITGDVFSAVKAAGVDDEAAKHAAAEDDDIKGLPQDIKERLGRIETALTPCAGRKASPRPARSPPPPESSPWSTRPSCHNCFLARPDLSADILRTVRATGYALDHAHAVPSPGSDA